MSRQPDRSAPYAGSDAGGDLDILIGELRREAARRRAAADFPIDLEVEVSRQLDAQSLLRYSARLDRLVGALETFAQPRHGPGRARQTAMRLVGSADTGLPQVARILSSALGLVSSRLRNVEARLNRLEGVRGYLDRVPGSVVGGGHERGADTPRPGASTPDRLELAGWLGGLDLGERSGGQRVLCSGSDVEGLVAHLRAQGVDAYGLVDDADPYLTATDLRSGDLKEHLGAVPDDALGEVIVAGALRVQGPEALAELATLLARTARAVTVLSESPWAWRTRLGPEISDFAAVRPFTAETWMAALTGAGFATTAVYAPRGFSYKVVARR
jgi:hypothetical protein